MIAPFWPLRWMLQIHNENDTSKFKSNTPCFLSSGHMEHLKNLPATSALLTEDDRKQAAGEVTRSL